MQRARNLLDNLIGLERDTISKDSDKCIFQTSGICPYEILKNTKISLGPCKYKNHKFKMYQTDILYKKELFKILEKFFCKIEQPCVEYKDDYITQKESEIDIKLANIEETITNQNIDEIYNLFLNIETEINELAKYKETIFATQKSLDMPKCSVCGMKIIKNFCSEKYDRHLQGRAHKGVLKMKQVYEKLKIELS